MGTVRRIYDLIHTTMGQMVLQLRQHSDNQSSRRKCNQIMRTP